VAYASRRETRSTWVLRTGPGLNIQRLGGKRPNLSSTTHRGWCMRRRRAVIFRAFPLRSGLVNFARNVRRYIAYRATDRLSNVTRGIAKGAAGCRYSALIQVIFRLLICLGNGAFDLLDLFPSGAFDVFVALAYDRAQPVNSRVTCAAQHAILRSRARQRRTDRSAQSHAENAKH
jgi:hypothetical protein